MAELGLSSDVLFTSYVPGADLPALYSGAAALVYPSFFEGFGAPPVEAMACGTPVVASTRPAFPEILGDAAMLVDPDGIIRLRLTNNAATRQTFTRIAKRWRGPPEFFDALRLV